MKLHWFEQIKYISQLIKNVSVDEMIACFSGRSAHTYHIKYKPTSEGYKSYSFVIIVIYIHLFSYFIFLMILQLKKLQI